VRSVSLLAEAPDWYAYDLPNDVAHKAWRGRYQGQRQKWFALRFTGDDTDIRLDLDPHPEFNAWRWAEIDELPAMAVPFKRDIYEVLARDFARYARPAG
jgi:putative (di)nucleoside polyphosphate hydrolase